MATKVRHRYAPRGNARTLMTSKAPEIVLSGPAGTGKSRSCLEKLHLACLAKANTRCLIVRRTFASIKHSALVTYKEHVAAEWLQAGKVTIFGGTVPQQVQYRNGSTIDIVGMDKETRVLSTEFDLIYVQEAIELEAGHWQTLSGRARNGNLRYQQLLADCNPSHDQHWLLQMAQEGHVLMLETKHEDNPRYFDADGTATAAGAAYIARLDNLTGVWYERLRLGKWVGAEGIIYDLFDRNHHVIDEMPAGWERWRRYWSVDFGYTNPFVVTMWAEDPDGRLYMYGEYYKTKMIVEEAAAELRGELQARPPHEIICDHDAEDRATFTKHTGRSTIAAKKSVSPGLQATASRFKVQKDGKARIYFLRNALLHKPDPSLIKARKPTSTLGEIGGYIWDPNGKDEPKKENDHGMDTKRYIVAHKDLRSRAYGEWV